MHSLSWILRRAVVVCFALAPMGAAAVASAQPAGTIYQTTLMEPGQKTPEVTTEALRMILADKSAIVFDTRPFLEYAMSHVRGALNVAAKRASRCPCTFPTSPRSGALWAATRPSR